MGRCATAVGGRTIGHRCVEQEETPQLDVHHHHTDHKTDREDHQVQQAIQAAGRRRRERRWQVLQERHSQQTQGRCPSQEDTLTKTGNIRGGKQCK